jgi:hypothetical protein
MVFGIVPFLLTVGSATQRGMVKAGRWVVEPAGVLFLRPGTVSRLMSRRPVSQNW